MMITNSESNGIHGLGARILREQLIQTVNNNYNNLIMKSNTSLDISTRSKFDHRTFDLSNIFQNIFTPTIANVMKEHKTFKIFWVLLTNPIFEI